MVERNQLDDIGEQQAGDSLNYRVCPAFDERGNQIIMTREMIEAIRETSIPLKEFIAKNFPQEEDLLRE